MENIFRPSAENASTLGRDLSLTELHSGGQTIMAETPQMDDHLSRRLNLPERLPMFFIC
jgi:hypothetical protein